MLALFLGLVLPKWGNHVTCVDVDEEKLNNLKKGVLPIYEPGLEAIVVRNFKDGLLNFTGSLSEAMEESSVFFIAVGTPPDEDGSADLQYVLAVAKEIGENLKRVWGYCR